MKKFSLIAAAMASVGLAHAAPLLHGSVTGGTGTTVALTVDANCEITQDISGTLDLGAVAPSNVFTIAPVSDVDAKVKCTRTTPFAVSVARSTNLISGANSIPYTLKFRGVGGIAVPTSYVGLPASVAADGTFDQSTGIGVGSGFLNASNAITIPFRARVEISDYQNAAPGTYSDATLVMTVTW